MPRRGPVRQLSDIETALVGTAATGSTVTHGRRGVVLRVPPGRTGRGVGHPLPVLLRWCLLLALIVVPGGSAEAQDGKGPGIRGFVEPMVAISAMAEGTPLFLGGRAGLQFPSGFLLRGGGRGLTRPLALTGASSPFELTFGYGGVGVGYALDGHRTEPSVSILLAAGHGEVRSRFTGAELASENLFVVEPEVSLRRMVHPTLALGASGGYRWVSAVEQLPGISPGGLRGWILSLSFRLQQRP